MKPKAIPEKGLFTREQWNARKEQMADMVQAYLDENKTSTEYDALYEVAFDELGPRELLALFYLEDCHHWETMRDDLEECIKDILEARKENDE